MGEIYIKYEYWIAAIQLVFAMLGMGATLTLNDFKDVAREPRAVSFGIIIQLVMVPLIALCFIYFTDISAGVAIGIALIASIPGGTTSNIFTYFARGNIPLSISITSITTFACLLTTPLILGLLITEYLPAEFNMPTVQIIKDIVFTLLLPLFVGMMIFHYLKHHAHWISKWSIRLSLIGILIIIIGSASAGRLDVVAYGVQNIFQVTAFILVLAILTWFLSRLLQFTKADSTAIEMEVIVRNVNLAVLIKASMFPVLTSGSNTIGDMVLLTVLLYGGLQLLISAFLIFIRRPHQ